MKKTNWCVITGAPSSGKTTIINALSVLGYQTAPEIARNYLGYLLNHNPHEYESLRSEVTVQSKIIELKLKREQQLCPEDLIFFDRGVPDSLAYFRYYNIDTGKMIEKMNIYQYAWVFFWKACRFSRMRLGVKMNIRHGALAIIFTMPIPNLAIRLFVFLRIRLSIV